ncbi:MAG: J domain-containing protein [Candidatus Anammoxibacter sp.]
MTEAYPLQWPVGKPRTENLQRSRFKISFIRARDCLVNELRLLECKFPVISTNIEVRRDGLPYANRPEPADPGVAVYFEHKGQQLCFACDRWDKVRDNLQAVNHTIAALRGIERWGTGEMVNQAFQGFKALPPPGNKREWWQVFGCHQDAPIDIRKQIYRKMSKIRHPDYPTGSIEEMQELNEAAKQAGIK